MQLTRADLFQRWLPIALTQLIGLTCGLIAVRLTSHLVAPEDTGLYALFTSLVPIGSGIVFAGLLKSAGRNWPQLDAGGRAQLLREIGRASARRLGWLALAALVAALLIAPAQAWWLCLAMTLTAALLSLAALVQATLVADRRHWLDCGMNAVGAGLRAFAPPLLYAALSATLPALVGGFTLHACVLAACGTWVLAQVWRSPVRPGGGRILTSVYESPLFVGLAVAGLLVLTCNRWLVVTCLGTETGGYFALANNAANILPSMLATMALQYRQPVWFARDYPTPQARRELAAQADRLAAAHALAALAASVTLHFSMPWLIGPLISPRYAAAADYMAPTGFFMTAVMTGYFYHTALLAARRERACGPTDLGGNLLLIAGSAIAVVLGAAWFKGWLLLSPVVPWLVNRTLARRALLKAD